MRPATTDSEADQQRLAKHVKTEHGSKHVRLNVGHSVKGSSIISCNIVRGSHSVIIIIIIIIIIITASEITFLGEVYLKKQQVFAEMRESRRG